MSFWVNFIYADESQNALNDLNKDLSAIPGLGLQYNGEKKISQEEALRLFTLSQKNYQLKKQAESHHCLTCGNQIETSSKNKSQDNKVEKSGWEVIFFARIGLRSGNSRSRSLSPESLGAERMNSDLEIMKGLSDKNQLSNEAIDQILDQSGKALGYNSETAMAYVAALGNKLIVNYGKSNVGKFVPRFEQIGRSFAGGSVGQCSDIHFAMLKAYKKLAGANAKAYLVNFQTSKKLHHTNLIIEDKGKINIIDYGEITVNNPGSIDILAQNSKSRSGHGLAYRIFSDDGEIDKMVAHIDTPLGKFLREVSTGNASYDPFVNTNYTTITAGINNQEGTAIRTFFGELGQGDAVMGVALDLKGIHKLPAGFKLQSYLASSLSYAHKTFRVASTSEESLHSGILYLNTGLGVLSPKLEIKGFNFQAQTDFYLEGGAWIKKYSEIEGSNNSLEGDFNLTSRTKLDISKQVTRKFKIDGSIEINLIPSFKTAFPSSTDGSSGLSGLGETLGILPNRVTASLNLQYEVNPKINIFAGLTYQHTPLGGSVQGKLGVGNSELKASAFLRGALDRDKTPIFIPGAERQVGVELVYCPKFSAKTTAIACFGLNANRSLENNSWGTSLLGEFKF